MNGGLLAALGADSGVICAVGAGGKKTTLYRIAAEHPGRVAITTTVFMTAFPRRLDAERVLLPSEALEAGVLAAADRSSRVAYACPSEKRGRHGGVPPERIAGLHRQGRFEITLVKADGARMRGIKAPAGDEPAIPPGADTVLFIVSAAVMGAPLDDRVAHRIERLEAVTGLHRGGTIEPGHVARLLVHPEGAAKGIGNARLIPVINQVDDDRRRQAAREAAGEALASGGAFDRVVLASMRSSDPLVEVVRPG